MISRKTLKLFGCHEAAVEQFAREAGLPVEPSPVKELRPGDKFEHAMNPGVEYVVISEDAFRRHTGRALSQGQVPAIRRQGEKGVGVTEVVLGPSTINAVFVDD